MLLSVYADKLSAYCGNVGIAVRRHRRPFRKRKRFPWLLVCIIIPLLAALFAFDRHFIPLLQQYSRTQAQWYLTRVVNEAVTEVLAEEKPTYDTLVKLSKDTDGNITSVESNTRTVNQLKAAVSAAVTAHIGKTETLTVSIPAGTLFGSRFFTGRGPRMEIPVSVSGSVLTTIGSTFTAAGVNQTDHRIEMQIKTSLFIAIPTAYTTTEVTTQFIIAESVLLGKVPDAYTVVEGDQQDTIGRIFDYSAQSEN